MAGRWRDMGTVYLAPQLGHAEGREQSIRKCPVFGWNNFMHLHPSRAARVPSVCQENRREPLTGNPPRADGELSVWHAAGFPFQKLILDSGCWSRSGCRNLELGATGRGRGCLGRGWAIEPGRGEKVEKSANHQDQNN